MQSTCTDLCRGIGPMMLVAAAALAMAEPAGASNHLAGASSPYLLQHADNPVDWYPWGEAAFAKARREHKPVFLSIGYSTCHWCHVMAHESFEDAGIAKILNGHFVSIKMDREEHPDLDESYMIATQVITGQGGWPNSLFLTPEGKPFFAGTYFPRDAFASLLQQIARQWQANPAPIRADAQKLSAIIESVQARRQAAQAVDDAALARAARQIMISADIRHGGFGGAPKFPQETTLAFLLGEAPTSGEVVLRQHVLRTLDAMIAGGLYDQIGGGFHRYAVDRAWRVPHFEKMLYSQALMAPLLLRAFTLTGAPRYHHALRDTLDYVLADLTSPQGGFYSARDADSEGAEGTFYVWTPAQLEAALGKEDSAFAARVFGITAKGNFEGGRSVPFLAEPPRDRAGQERLAHVRQKLRQARAQRPAPHRDEKIITAWNGLMIQALAQAALALDEPRYGEAARRAGDFLWHHLRQQDGALMRASFAGKTAVPGTQKDYAAAALGFIALYDLDKDARNLERAQDITAQMQERFHDAAAGDFYLSAKSGLFGRPKSFSDNPLPSGNALALEVYARLARRSGDAKARAMTDGLTAALSGQALQNPAASAHALYALDLLRHGEPGPVHYLADGHVRVLSRVAGGQLHVDLHIDPGWHINARRPLEDYLAPTVLEIEGTANAVVYPEAEQFTPDFNAAPMAVYSGHVRISAALAPGAMRARLRLQACDARQCLAPESLEFDVPQALEH